MKFTSLSAIGAFVLVSACNQVKPDEAARPVERVEALVREARLLPLHGEDRTPEDYLYWSYQVFKTDEGAKTFEWEKSFDQMEACRGGQYFVFMALGYGGGPVGEAIYCQKNGSAEFYARNSGQPGIKMFQDVDFETLLECPVLSEPFEIPENTHSELVYLLSSRGDVMWSDFDANCYRKAFLLSEPWRPGSQAD